MPEHYAKVEIVRPFPKGFGAWADMIYTDLIELAINTLLVWWFFAAWFPQFGLTYWQLALPVYVVRSLTSHPVGRLLDRESSR